MEVTILLTSGALRQFPIAALSNYCRFNCLNNTNLLSYSSVGQKSDIGLTGLKSRCRESSILEVLRVEFVSCFSACFAIIHQNCNRKLIHSSACSPLPVTFNLPLTFKVSSREVSSGVHLSPLTFLITAFADFDLSQEGILLKIHVIKLGHPDNPG